MLSVLGSRASEAAEGRICDGGVTGTVFPKIVIGMLLGTGGVGIFQWFIGLSGDTFSLRGLNVGDDLELNQLFALEAPFLIITLGCRRRKSVLTPCDIGIGSDMPVIVPVPVRPRLYEFEYLSEDQLESFEWGRSSFERRRPRNITAMTAIKAPTNMPGKNPTATAPPGNRGHSGVLSAAAGLVESIPAAGVAEVAEPVDVDEADGDPEALPVELVALSITHCELLSQV